VFNNPLPIPLVRSISIQLLTAVWTVYKTIDVAHTLLIINILAYSESGLVVEMLLIN